MTFIPEPRIKTADSMAVDSFGRLRVSQPTTLFDSKQLFDNAPLFWAEKEIVGGTSTYVAARAASEMEVTNNADRVIRQTKQRFAYQPGRSLLVMCTGVLARTTAATGATSKIGYFDGYNGLYFELEDTTMNVVKISDGVEVESVAQSSWNIDTMDGYGPSGLTLDPTKAQIFAIDLQWLGVGRVRMAFDIDGVFIPVHEFLHANNDDSVYMINPNLPVRYEIESTGSARSMDHICVAVTGEGVVSPAGVVKAIDRGITPTALSSAFVPVISIRLKSTHTNAVVLPVQLEVVSTSGADLRFALLINPTIAGTDAASWTSLSDSAVEYDVSRSISNTLSGGTQIASGYVLSANNAVGSNTRNLDLQLRIGSDIDEVRDELVLGVQSLSGTGQFIGGITVRELL